MNTEQTAAAQAAFNAPETMTGYTVDEVRSYHYSKAKTIVLVPTVGTALALDDTKLHFLLTTEDPEIIAELPLGRTIGFSDDPHVDLQAGVGSAIVDGLKHFGKGLAAAFGATITVAEKTAAEQAVIAFVGKDGMALAVDAVQYINVHLPGVGGVEARDAAVAKLKTDAAAAKKDLSTMATAALNFVIEGALQIALSQGMQLIAKAATAV